MSVHLRQDLHLFSSLVLQVVVGVVYNPIMEEMFTAVRGKGAFLNGSPIHASACSSLGSALAISEIGVTRDDETLDALFGRISALTKQVRRHCICGCAVKLAVLCLCPVPMRSYPDLAFEKCLTNR